MKSRPTGRHAYCLIVHSDRYCLETLLTLIADPRNDIFVLRDKKSPVSLTEGLEEKFTNVYVLPAEKCVDVRWGGLSLVKAELTVLQAAVDKGGYDFIHLMSGADLPLHTQDEIHQFFSRFPAGSNFLEFTDEEAGSREIEKRTAYRYILLEHQRVVGSGVMAKARLLGAKILRHLWLRLQKLSGARRNWGDTRLAIGLNWGTLSEDFARYLTHNRARILQMFQGVLIADEIYKQTMAVNSEFDSTLKSFSRGNSDGIRLMDWERGDTKKGSPYVWRMEDWEALDTAFEPFARKFSSTVDRPVIDRLRKKLNTNF